MIYTVLILTNFIIQRNINIIINLCDLDGHLQCFAVAAGKVHLTGRKTNLQKSRKVTLQRPLHGRPKSWPWLIQRTCTRCIGLHTAPLRRHFCLSRVAVSVSSYLLQCLGSASSVCYWSTRSSLVTGRVSTTPGNTRNTGNLLEFEIPPENTKNLLDFCWCSWKNL